METMKVNDYGMLCTEMYECLHAQAPSDELPFTFPTPQRERVF